MVLPKESDALRGQAGHAFASMAGLFLTRKPLLGPRKNQAISRMLKVLGRYSLIDFFNKVVP